MPYGYLGVKPNQKLRNAGILDVTDHAILNKNGELGDSLQLIQTQTVSSAVATVDFTAIGESKYDVHLITYTNVTHASSGNSKRMVMRFFESGTIEAAGVYHDAKQVNYAGGTHSDVNNTTSNAIRIDDGTGEDTGENSNGYIYCYNLGDSNKYSYATSHQTGIASTNVGWSEFGGGVLPQASTVDGIRFLMDGDFNFVAGTFKLYGVKQT